MFGRGDFHPAVDHSEELRGTELAKVSAFSEQQNGGAHGAHRWESTADNSLIAGNSGKALLGLRVPDVD